ILGYRIAELAEAGREEDAAAALGFVADATGFGDRSGLLHILAEGLERHHLTRLATLAYTLAWTRARGHGGWPTFGGETGSGARRSHYRVHHCIARRTSARCPGAEAAIPRGGGGAPQ